FSSAIAAYLSKGYSIEESINSAEVFFNGMFQKFIELPDQGKILDFSISDEQLKIINQIKKIYNFISSYKEFSKIIPEVRMNISGALSNARNIQDIAGIEGRITIISDYPYAAGDVKFGVSNHTARLLLTAKKYDKSINFVINLRYNPKLINKILKNTDLDLQEIKRNEQPEETKEKESLTMQWLIKKSINKIRRIPDIIWDKGAIGKEPMIRLFGKNAENIIKKLEKIKDLI
ncbi:MAG: thiamine-phosphate synthase family protein, partial [Promethearchaeota archaeon]